MEEIIEFTESFIDAEYQALVARYTNRDDAVLLEKKIILEEYLSSDVKINLQRGSNTPDSWFEVGQRNLDNGKLIPRKLFQIKEYFHPTWGTMYRIYTSNPNWSAPGRLSYRANFFVSLVDDSLKIISYYTPLLPFMGGGRNSFKENGLVWEWESGIMIDELGKLVDVRKFLAPEQADALADYEVA